MPIPFNPKKDDNFVPLSPGMSREESERLMAEAENREFEMDALKVEGNKLIFLNEKKGVIVDIFEYNSHEEAVDNFNTVVELLELTIPFKDKLYAK
jgi:putative NADH-flavin reductase